MSVAVILFLRYAQEETTELHPLAPRSKKRPIPPFSLFMLVIKPLDSDKRLSTSLSEDRLNEVWPRL